MALKLYIWIAITFCSCTKHTEIIQSTLILNTKVLYKKFLMIQTDLMTLLHFPLFRTKLFYYLFFCLITTVNKIKLENLNFDICALLPLACSKIWLPERRRVEALDRGRYRQEDWGQLHGQPEGWSSSVRVSCFYCCWCVNLENDCIGCLTIIIFLFLSRLINALQPGSVRKINNPSQNWHQVT